MALRFASRILGKGRPKGGKIKYKKKTSSGGVKVKVKIKGSLKQVQKAAAKIGSGADEDGQPITGAEADKD
jgi:hypothetical protein